MNNILFIKKLNTKIKMHLYFYASGKRCTCATALKQSQYIGKYNAI